MIVMLPCHPFSHKYDSEPKGPIWSSRLIYTGISSHRVTQRSVITLSSTVNSAGGFERSVARRYPSQMFLSSVFSVWKVNDNICLRDILGLWDIRSYVVLLVRLVLKEHRPKFARNYLIATVLIQFRRFCLPYTNIFLFAPMSGQTMMILSGFHK